MAVDTKSYATTGQFVSAPITQAKLVIRYASWGLWGGIPALGGGYSMSMNPVLLM